MEIDRNLAPPWARRVGYSNRNAERLRAKSSVKVKSEGRNPKAEARIALGLGFRSSNFGTRPSFGPRPSDFGLQSYLTPRPLRGRRRGGGSRRASGGRLGQSRRQIHPAAPVWLAGRPDESGVLVVVWRIWDCLRIRSSRRSAAPVGRRRLFAQLMAVTLGTHCQGPAGRRRGQQMGELFSSAPRRAGHR